MNKSVSLKREKVLGLDCIAKDYQNLVENEIFIGAKAGHMCRVWHAMCRHPVGPNVSFVKWRGKNYPDIV